MPLSSQLISTLKELRAKFQVADDQSTAALARGDYKALAESLDLARQILEEQRQLLRNASGNLN